ncbi:MAG: hypothetical protein LH613_03150 [Chamaesiphon sp.]|nr:hypothetical protein [Chamaesiphon sp.]
MDSTNITPDKTPAVAIESTEKSQTFTEALSAMKEQNESEAQRIVTTATKGKPQTLAEACLVMKDENIEEAHRIVPDRSTADKVTET